ncbi:MAG TPA: ATP synthase F1 subunit gamma [Anaerolinea thermolimosa]|uniref:ATP synthase gamma chain n=1 Tax=Anaerolinea thermolimosa TaxID=229919 RepID=A0A3D1JJ66_9CHLR|nr:ATP synthase F1 subunit gamma [Anaerolinea thermolimosa]GAP06247.1 ATP synthase, F1 gamma subunit [Anaerolinea thermolimosa]HCE18543.1 ATP synthase F1 subunit gamma [Anaerolinea thermolimosa]
MPSTREMRLRIRSVKNLAQVTRALETVSASRVRKAIQANNATMPYAEKAWKVLIHLARQPGRDVLHPLLRQRDRVDRILVIMVSSDRGLAGAYNMNITRHTLSEFDRAGVPVDYVTVGRKGRELLVRKKKNVVAAFVDLPSPPSFNDVAAIGQLVVDDYLKDVYDQVFITYTHFRNMIKQEPVTQKLLPLTVVDKEHAKPGDLSATHRTSSVFTYEPDQNEVLENVVPHFTAIQIYKAILSAQASEHAARMVAMRNATESANELVQSLQLEYNKLRQSIITNEMLDIAGGANALQNDERGVG